MYMRLFIFAIAILFLQITPSCHKFLDTKPQDFISPVNYYKTEEDLNRALTGVYDRLGDMRLYTRGMFSFMVFSDEFYIKGGTSGINSNRIDASTLELNRQWEAIYTGIERANMLLENMDQADVSAEFSDEIKGQALFLRGYYYFLLVDQYGAVPLKLSYTKSPTEAPLAPSSIAEVYEQITKDMKDAENLVKPISDYGFNGRISRTAVQGILARVYLTMAGFPLRDQAKYADAKAYAQKVMESGEHSLNPDYKQIFINHSQEKYDIKEGLWEIEFGGTNQGTIREGGSLGSYLGIFSTNIDSGYGYDLIHANRKLWNAYEPNDLRRDWAIAPYRFVTTGNNTSRVNWAANQIYERSAGKWRREYETVIPRNKDFNGTNFPMLRYADVLLMFAEADNEINNGASAAGYIALNEVRRRGYGKPVSQANASIDIAPGLSKDAFRQVIQNERLRELSFEGIRKHDLVRWGIYVKAMQELIPQYEADMPAALRPAGLAQARNITERNVLFPVPNSEITINPNMTQNTGW
jgi:hypothetical protein